MLKQVFDKEQISKVLTPSDVQKWRILSNHDDIESAISSIENYWRKNSLALLPLQQKIVKKKPVFSASSLEDNLSIRLVDRFIRRVYKVRQSDRNRIVKQLLSLLKDSGDHHVIRLDIKDCYESIPLIKMINKLEDDLILAPECIKLLNFIHSDLKSNYQFEGLPRGLSISPTLAELYLESLDNSIASHPSVIYSARYVDDIIIIVPKGQESNVEKEIKTITEELNLKINEGTKKYYSEQTRTANFDYLGYSIKVSAKNRKPNEVEVVVSSSKLNKIKYRITKSFCDHKKQRNIGLLKRRLEYLSTLKSVKKGKNGDLLAGIAHNYQYVTDDFKCLKDIDGFLCAQLRSPRFGLSVAELNKINKISFYGNVKGRKIGNFSKLKTVQIMRVWKDV
ncbi:RNA-directed DNA polymerase [Ferrimonas balearica]|uniref:antiviral reverse transcriptase Drt3a n=1 Tax=Ferrimonas balearica TaxID=44012 RepID=UPI001C963E28|nr:antiviral reverse transcriptase Drt3a [Ferrimonas balearica]MBY6108359.1 RNA-directed DNA polymerase [Ferrimonas balearica]